MSTGQNIVLDAKYVGDIVGDYYVPSYQRGYRWGRDEVIRLLDDIFENGANPYCLQPIVVKSVDGQYELIDGQQRLTTLYLIYKFMNERSGGFIEAPKFSLKYETRTESQEFLKDIDFNQKEKYIDYWFICEAYTAIKEWFETKPKLSVAMTDINNFLTKYVRIIWYEVEASEDSIALFTRLNIGKIPLTSSELVKAMFLSKNLNNGIDQEKQEEIALQWDNIERELHQQALWYFLTNSEQEKYPTRIDLILDLISGKEDRCREKYYTFFKFEDLRKGKELKTIWKDDIQRTFLILKDWFENHELYHKIGYLITSGYSLVALYNASQGKTKTEFMADLNQMIRDSIALRDGMNYGDLSYEKPYGYDKIPQLLLLFNVESVMRNGEQSQWFPFGKFKSRKTKNVSWSLEHIHAQQSEGLVTQADWKEWIRLHIPSIQALIQEGKITNGVTLVDRMNSALADEKLERTVFEDIQKDVVSYLSQSGSVEYMHSISNLALLKTDNNAALNNSTFDVKRNSIIELDKNGEFIPYCTKMVFLKYYTPSEENQLHFWGAADRKSYINEINTVLKDYLPAPIILEKEDN